MATSYKISDLKSVASSGKSQRKTKSKTTQLKSMARKFSISGQMIKMGTGVSTDFIANAIMGAYQCSVVNGQESKKGYSLLDSESDTETIANENILDTSAYEKISNSAQTAEGRFSNKDDPFYNLDDALPNRLQSKRQKSIQKNNAPDLIEITLSIGRT
jgi:hypothetical protein